MVFFWGQAADHRAAYDDDNSAVSTGIQEPNANEMLYPKQYYAGRGVHLLIQKRQPISSLPRNLDSRALCIH